MASRKKSARKSEPLHTVTVRLPRSHAAVLARAAQLAGVDVETIARVVLALGILRELAKMDGDGQAGRVEVARQTVRRAYRRELQR